VALDLPPEAQEALIRFREEAADHEIWRRLPDEALHLTLVFLGYLTDDQHAELDQIVSDTPPSSFNLSLSGTLLLPRSHPRVLCADVADRNGGLVRYQQELSSRLQAANLYTPEKRSFHPHITVARVLKSVRAPRKIEIRPEEIAFQANEVSIYRSELHPAGAQYTRLQTIGSG
jgi:2'-5' RNA ligase